MAVRAGQGSRTAVPRAQSPFTEGGPGDGAPGTAAKSVQIPKTNKNPLWSIAPAPIVVISHGRLFEIGPTYAADWLEYLFTDEYPDLYGLITSLLPDLDEYFFDLALPTADMYRVALEVIEAASARSWWVALRLLSVVYRSWHILGPQLVFKGVDATAVTLAAWLDCALYIIIEHMDPDKVAMFNLQLEKEPPQLDPFADPAAEDEAEETDPFSSVEMDGNAFLALA